MKIVSKIGKVFYPEELVYAFISDFRNFNNFIPKEKVSNWEANNDTCSFSMDMLGKVGLMIVEREKHSLIKISSDPAKSQYNFHLWIQLKEASKTDTRIKITMEPLLNQVLLAMVKKPLKSFVDSLVDELEKFDFESQ